MKKLLAFLTLATLAACGPIDKDKLDDLYKPTGLPQYCFQGENDRGQTCSTGIIRFNNHNELCRGIQNENLNSRCGFETENRRRKYFRDFCEGEFKPDMTPMDPPNYEPCSEIVVRRPGINTAN